MHDRACEAVGIDLGTTYSSLAYMDSQLTPRIVADSSGSTILPSAIYFSDEGVIVGDLALEEGKADASRVVTFVKVHMGDQWRVDQHGHTHTPESLSALILAHLVREAASQIGTIKRAVITVPAYFTEKRRRATQQAGEIAGLEVIGTLNEPMAATLAYGLNRQGDDLNVVVYDLGGGTFDVTVVQITPDEILELATAGNRRLGGRDWDKCLIDLVAEEFERKHGVDPRGDAQARLDLQVECERAKRRLTRSKNAAIRLQAFQRDHVVDITRDRFEQVSAPLLQTTRLTLDMAVEDAGLTWDEISRVVLVGGSTLMPGVRRMIEEVAGFAPDTGVNPVLAVALGAAVYAHILEAGQQFQAVAASPSARRDVGDALAAGEEPAAQGETPQGAAPASDANSGSRGRVATVAATAETELLSHDGGPAAKTPAESAEADDLGFIRDYQLIEKIGEGGMGTVYRAKHTKLDMTVAIKVLVPEKMGQERAVERFEREMRAVGQLRHQNIVLATDAGVEGRRHYLAMEYVEGFDLAKLVARIGTIRVTEACELIRQAAVGLQCAHEHEFVHRDIKPSNLILTHPAGEQPLVKILDLGIARLRGMHAQRQDDLTGEGQMVGTLDFMAPEQGDDSRAVDCRADIYSLGATFFSLLVGEAPFSRKKYKSLCSMLTAIATEEAPSIRTKRNDLPNELVSIIDRMLSRDPADRFDTAREVADALEPFAADADLADLLRWAKTDQALPPAGPADFGKPTTDGRVGPAGPLGVIGGTVAPPPRQTKVRFVTAHGVGVRVRTDEGFRNSVIIPPNSRVPVEQNKRFVTAAAARSGTCVKIQILQGDSPDPALAEVLGTGRIEEVGDNQPPGQPVDVVMSFDEQGRLHVRAIYVNTGQEMQMSVEVEGGLRPEEIENHQDFLERSGYPRVYSPDTMNSGVGDSGQSVGSDGDEDDEGIPFDRANL